MAEQFNTYNVSSIPDILYSVYQEFLSHPIMRVVAASDGTAIGTPGSAAFFSADNSYIVVEPVKGYASGAGRWQCQLLHDTLVPKLQYNGSLQNTFDITTELFTPDLTTGLLDVISGTIDANSTLYIATGDSEYAYCKLITQRNSGVVQNGLYMGGYAPFSAADTRPVCFLAGEPFVGNTANDWGATAQDATNRNRTQVEYAQTTRPSGAGYASLKQQEEVRTSSFQTYDGINVAVPLFLFALPNNILGTFSALNMVGSNQAIADGTADSLHSLIHLGGVAHRWVT